MASVQTNSGVITRLFVQEKAGAPLHYVGCVGVRNIVIDPRQLEFSRVVDETGVVTSVIPRFPNPSNFDVSFGCNYRKWQSIFLSTRHGCKPNLFLANSYCEDSTRIDDPNYYQEGVWLYSITPASGYQLSGGSTSSVDIDPNTAVRRVDQISFVHEDGVFVGTVSYNPVATLTGPVKSLAVLDNGQCGDVICRPCDAPGCLSILASTGSDFRETVDGGENWAIVSGSGAGVAQAFNGNGFMVGATSIKISNDLTLAAASWTAATTDVSFAGLTEIAQIDNRTLVVGGSQGAVWRSSNGGGTWTQIRAAAGGSGDFQAMAYNPVTKLLVGILKLTTTVQFAVSSDRGKSWSILTPNPVTGETAGANSNYIVQPAGPNTFLVVNGNLYKLDCSGSTVTYSAVSVLNATGSITGILSLKQKNDNQLFLTTGNNLGGGKIFVTNDAFNSAVQEVLTFSISTAGTIVNPMALCQSRYGNSLLAAFGTVLVKGDDFDSWFSTD